jgi:hypothetical protein
MPPRLTLALVLVAAFVAACHSCAGFAPCSGADDCENEHCVRGFCAQPCSSSSDCLGVTHCEAGVCLDDVAGEGEGAASEGETGEGEGAASEGEGAAGEGEGEGATGEGEGEGAAGEGEGGAGEGEGEGAASCAPIVNDGFDGPEVAPGFSVFGGAGAQSSAGIDGDTSELVLSVPAGDERDYCGVDSVGSRDWTGTVMQVEMDGAPVAGVDMYMEMVPDNATNGVLANLTGVSKTLQIQENGSFLPAQSSTFDATQDRVWRLVFDPAAPTLFTSADGATFVPRAQLPQDANGAQIVAGILHSGFLEIGHGAFQAGTPASTDHVMSVTAWPSLACANQCNPTRLDLRSVADLQSPFAPYADSGVTTTVDHGVHVALTGVGGHFGGIAPTLVGVDLRNKVLEVRFVDAKATVNKLNVYMGALNPADTTQGVRMETGSNGDGLIYLDFNDSSGGITATSPTAYSAVTDRVWRLVLDPARTVALSSADGESFVERAAIFDSDIDGFLSHAVLSIGAGADSNPGPTTTIDIASITVWPSLACAPQ